MLQYWQRRRAMSNKCLHAVIYDKLLNRIINNEFKDTNKLPSETELQEHYGVSRITIRRAIQDLQNDGYVVKFSGKGTIIQSQKIILDLQKLDSFSNETKIKGIHSYSILIKFENILPPVKVKNALNLLNNDKVYYIERIRCMNNSKIGIHRSYISQKNNISLTEFDFKDKHASLYEQLKKHNIQLYSAQENIEAIMPSKSVQKLLDLPNNIPIFYRERLTFDINNIPIEYVEMYYRSDDYKYKIKLTINK